MSMKNSSDTIGNRTCELSAYTAVPQPTVPPHASWIIIGKEQRWPRENSAQGLTGLKRENFGRESKSPGSLLVKSTTTMWVTKLQVIEYFMLWTEYIMEEYKEVVGSGPERKRQKGRQEIWQMLQVKQWNSYNK